MYDSINLYLNKYIYVPYYINIIFLCKIIIFLHLLVTDYCSHYKLNHHFFFIIVMNFIINVID